MLDLIHVFTARVDVGVPLELGQVSTGRRRVIPIVGGTVEGLGVKFSQEELGRMFTEPSLRTVLVVLVVASAEATDVENSWPASPWRRGRQPLPSLMASALTWWRPPSVARTTASQALATTVGAGDWDADDMTQIRACRR